MLKRSLKILVGGLLALSLAGCTTPYGAPNNTGTGVLLGGMSGAGLGAVLAHCDPGFGALVGGLAGAVAGGLIGNTIDQQARAPVYVAGPPPPYASVNGQWVWNGNSWVWSEGPRVTVP